MTSVMVRLCCASIVAATVLACSDSSSDESGTTSTGGGTGSGGSTGQGGDGGQPPQGCAEGPALPDEPACEACQNQRCCTTAPGCTDNSECVAIQDCVNAGGSQECLDDHPDGLWDYSGLLICRENQCAAECGFEAPVCGEIIPTPASCTDEVRAECCDEMTACGANDDCVAIIYQCIDENECTTAACFSECVNTYPEGAGAFNALGQCFNMVACL